MVKVLDVSGSVFHSRVYCVLGLVMLVRLLFKGFLDQARELVSMVGEMYSRCWGVSQV